MNILFTSAGRRSYLVKYFKDVLGNAGTIHAANSSIYSAAMEAADKAVCTPLIYSDEYIPFLLNYCKKENINAIIPLFDIDIPVLARNRERFEQMGVRLIVSDIKIAEICNDKWLTYQFLKENGFEAPQTFCELQKVYDALENKKISFPLMIKPRWGMGSIDIYEAENEEELEVLFKKAKREVFNSYLKYESGIDAGRCVIIQQKITGQEYGIDNINDLDGHYRSTVIRKKISMRSGETDCAEIVEEPVIRETAQRLASLTKHIGNMDVDMFVEDDKVYVLEMNARFGGGYPFSHIAGVDLPKAIVQWLNGGDVDQSVLVAETGVIGQKDISMIKVPGKRRMMNGEI